ncbi:Lrp/AsnC family transcriptional regulator [Streptomyces sp. NPDC057702]|uniref:Lrp/AsnC family transcriptional regulator n=1 Tax=unclassified Streptomyces TaxID=2593676 RepID=UPI003699C230
MKPDVFDDLDRQLVHALQIDGRAPFARIATALGVSDQTVARRYTRLRTNGLIQVLGLTDARPLGETAWFLRVRCRPDAAVPVAEALARRPDTSWVALMSGGTEITVVVRSGSEQDSDGLLLRELPRTPQVVDVTAQYMLHQFFGGQQGLVNKSGALSDAQVELVRAGASQEVATPLGTSSGFGAGVSLSMDAAFGTGTGSGAAGFGAGLGAGPAVGAGGGPLSEGAVPPAAAVVLGEGDRRLLGVLELDGRAPLGDLAAATGWSQSTVRRRLAELRELGVLYFDVDYDGRLFDIGTRVILWMAVPPSDLHETGERIAAHPEVACCYASTGKHNLFAIAICSDTAAFYRYLTVRVAALPAIRRLETAPMIRRVKGPGPVFTGAPLRRGR